MIVDLHLHTDCSDGKLSIEDTLKVAINNQISLISVTDHDSLSGLEKVISLSHSYGINCVSGIELSCRNDNIDIAFPQDISIHILGYNIDYDNKELNSYIKQYHLQRRQILSMLIKELSENGFDIKYENIFVIAGNQMRIQDIVNYINSSFISKKEKKYLMKIANTYYEKLFMIDTPLCDAIELIKGAGGIPVLAHAFFSYHDYDIVYNSKKDILVLLDYLCSLKISGLEVFYSRFNKLQIDFLLTEAKKRNLIVTAGSDFHGTPHRKDMINYEICTMQKTIEFLLKENRYQNEKVIDI